MVLMQISFFFKYILNKPVSLDVLLIWLRLFTQSRFIKLISFVNQKKWSNKMNNFYQSSHMFNFLLFIFGVYFKYKLYIIKYENVSFRLIFQRFLQNLFYLLFLNISKFFYLISLSFESPNSKWRNVHNDR